MGLRVRGAGGHPGTTVSVIHSQNSVIDLDDPAMTRVWGDHLTRIVLRAMAPARDGRYVITVARHP